MVRRFHWFFWPLTIAAVAGVTAYYAMHHYTLDQAAKNIREVLLSHRGVHHYNQRTMHPEFYRARGDGEIAPAYYAPELLSSSFMVRVLHGFYNEEREQAGLPPVYYKMAADNPRNPVNRADGEELALLAYFREHPQAQEVREVKEIGGRAYLTLAMPFLRNEQRCLVCHGKREDAPPGLQARYPGQGGFEETLGGLRAIESVRVPLADESAAALVVALGALAGFAGLGALLVFSRALTHRVRAQTAALAGNERTFRRLLDAAEAVPFQYSLREDRYTHMGPQFAKVFGEGVPVFQTAADWDALLHPEDRDTFWRACWTATREGKDCTCQLRLLRRDDTSAVVQVSVNVVQDESAGPQAVGFIQDITAITRSEAMQRARVAVARAATDLPLKELLSLFLDQAEALTESRIGFFHTVLYDQQTLCLQRWSHHTETVCQTEGAGQHYPLAQAGVWADSLRTGKVVMHNDYATLEGKRGLPEGHVPLIRDLVVPLRHGDKVVAILGVGNKAVPYDSADVAALGQLAEFALEIILRKRAEEETEAVQGQLVQAQKVEAIGRLAGGVAHDFNNMLSVILGYADLLLGKLDPHAPQYAGLTEIKKAAERSAAITRQLLAFARKQVASPQVVDLNDAVDSMLKMLQRLIGEDIDLTWRPQPGLWPVFIDPSQVDQLLANLATNARDAIAGVGKVTLETHNAEFDAAYCRIHPEFQPGRYVVLAVSDNGCGISGEEQKNLFEPFYTTKETGEGTGLGLATVHGIVKQNGGAINVYSELEQGTTFKLYLPAYQGKAVRQAPAAGGARDLTGSETLLLVEDEPAILRLGEKILKGFGYTVLAARTPAEAIAAAAEYPSTIHLLVTDVVMPGMNGKDLVAHLAATRPDMACLFVSGYTANVIVHRGILDDGVQFVAKPFTRQELGAKVREILDG